MSSLEHADASLVEVVRYREAVGPNAIDDLGTGAYAIADLKAYQR